MIKATILCGLFDKDTKKQEIPTKAAMQKAKDVVLYRISGGTISEAAGVYTHDDGTPVEEPTIRVEADDVTIEAAEVIAEDLKKAFNQEAVLVEITEPKVKFI